jgi:Cu(I)/Ag(I) efflux system membrane fusion protein
MKKSWRNNLVVFVTAILLVACSGEKHAENADTYTCPMHPTVVSDRPGTCPVCGMDLVRKARPGEEVQMTAELSRLIRSPNESVIANVATTKPVYKAMNVTLNATGTVTYDTRKLNAVSTRVGGRLESVFIKYDFQPVQKGQKVAEIYSPELLTAQRELLFLVRDDPANQSLIDAAKSKLLLMGATQKQIDNVARSGKPIYNFPIYSPVVGYVVSNSIARVGSYVAAGETLFSIVETKTLWVELNVRAAQAGLVKKNDTVRLDVGNGRSAKGRVDLVEPLFNDGEQFSKVRVYVEDENLRVGQLVNATLTSSTSEGLWLPKTSVVDLGVDKVVFVKDHEVLKPKSVIVGVQADDWVEIRQGLLSADDVAKDAQYLIDSESFIKTAETGTRTSDEPHPSQQHNNDNSLMLSETQVKLANITTQKITTGPVGQTIRVNGQLVVDENRSETVSSRASGRIEKLFVKETGRVVRKGEVLYELYSEELLTLQKEYLLAKDQYENLGSKEARYESFLKAAERKLILYGMTAQQVQKLAVSRTADQRISFVSPSTGTVSQIGITEGQYVDEGTLLYKIEDVGRLWVEAELYANETTLVKSGAQVTVRVGGFENTPIDATIDFVAPEYKANTQISIVRASISNPALQFKPGMQAQITFTRSAKKGLTVPTDAIIRDANGTHVYVQSDVNTFQPRMVKTGVEDFERAEIIEGLSENEVVAASGAYLLYSEFILKKGRAPMAGHHH